MSEVEHQTLSGVQLALTYKASHFSTSHYRFRCLHVPG